MNYSDLCNYVTHISSQLSCLVNKMTAFAWRTFPVGNNYTKPWTCASNSARLKYFSSKNSAANFCVSSRRELIHPSFGRHARENSILAKDSNVTQKKEVFEFFSLCIVHSFQWTYKTQILLF